MAKLIPRIEPGEKDFNPDDIKLIGVVYNSFTYNNQYLEIRELNYLDEIKAYGHKNLKLRFEKPQEPLWIPITKFDTYEIIHISIPYIKKIGIPVIDNIFPKLLYFEEYFMVFTKKYNKQKVIKLFKEKMLSNLENEKYLLEIEIRDIKRVQNPLRKRVIS